MCASKETSLQSKAYDLLFELICDGRELEGPLGALATTISSSIESGDVKVKIRSWRLINLLSHKKTHRQEISKLGLDKILGKVLSSLLAASEYPAIDSDVDTFYFHVFKVIENLRECNNL